MFVERNRFSILNPSSVSRSMLPAFCFACILVFSQKALPAKSSSAGPLAPIPPEIWQQLAQPAGSEQPAPSLPLPQRMLLLILALAIMLAGAFLCRFLKQRRQLLTSSGFVLLLFGLLGAIDALIVAAACTGNLYLHLAPAVCIITSGFTITAFLLSQFSAVRSWLAPNKSKTLYGERNHDPSLTKI